MTLGLHQHCHATAPAPARWVGLLACAACASAAAAEAPAPQETFRWHGELVALDEGARELTVKARLTSATAVAEMPAVEAGDAILITWAGFENRAHGIRAVTPDDGASGDGADAFVGRAGFVSLDPATRYVLSGRDPQRRRGRHADARRRATAPRPPRPCRRPVTASAAYDAWTIRA